MIGRAQVDLAQLSDKRKRALLNPHRDLDAEAKHEDTRSALGPALATLRPFWQSGHVR